MRTAILIIGSLLWDNEHRKLWRDSRLSCDAMLSVKAPIRYGRRSFQRQNTFTMIFDPNHEPGCATLVPCQEILSDIDDLKAEAEALWGAERKEPPDGTIGTTWGSVGAVFRDESLELCKEWTGYFHHVGGRPIIPIDKNGLLRIAWPLITESRCRADFDVILATANQPRPPEVPTPQAIADAWIEKDSEERYFFRNVENDIRTSADKAIWERMKATPGYGKAMEARYPNAVKILQGE
jgi:hypothetical protein